MASGFSPQKPIKSIMTPQYGFKKINNFTYSRGSLVSRFINKQRISKTGSAPEIEVDRKTDRKPINFVQTMKRMHDFDKISM